MTLWEALYGERPFAGASREELRANVLAGKLRPPPKTAVVPSWLRQACERGLSGRPEQRWPSMNALLTALGQGRTRARRRLWLASLGVLVVLGIGGEGHRRWSVAQRVAACEQAADEIEAAWNTEHREAVHAALLATGAGHAATTSDKLMPWIDRQATAWREARVETCLDAEVRERWSAALHERSLWCLDERRTELQSLVHELTRADVGLLNKAVPAAAGLASVSPCRDEGALEALGLPAADDREAARAIRVHVTWAANLERGGRYDQALALAQGALERASALEWRPLSAVARARVGRLLEHTGAYAEAEIALEDAYFEAADGVAPEAAAEAAAELVYLLSEKLARHADAKRWGRHAEVALAALREGEGLTRARLLRGLAAVHYHTGAFDDAKALGERLVALQEALLGPTHPDLATSLNNLAGAHWASGDYAGAMALSERSLAIREQALGPDHPDVAMSLGNLANLHRATGQYEPAKALFARALAIDEKALGPEHPDVALTLLNFGNLHFETGDLAQAKALFERALAISTKAMGPEHPHVATSLNNLANVHVAMGDHAEAKAMFERSLAILEKALGSEHPDVLNGLVNLADAHGRLGDHERAEALLERALAIGEKTLDPAHPQLALVLHNLGRARFATGDHERAEPAFARALAIREEALGPRHSDVALTLGGLATVALARGRASDAVPLASRAVAIEEESGGSPVRLANARLTLAQALWDAAKDGAPERARAVSLAEQARELLVERGSAEELAAVQQWLAGHAAAAP